MYQTWGYREERRTYYNQGYHTYGFEWNDQYMWTCESSPRQRALAELV